jgi:hypothetical protein
MNLTSVYQLLAAAYGDVFIMAAAAVLVFFALILVAIKAAQMLGE